MVYDIILFGASGFTGKHVLLEMKSLEGITWAVAGRDETKLKSALSEVGAEAEIVIANVDDEASLDAMCKKTKMVITVVGPYRKFGEPLVAACVKNGIDCVDICGEPEFLERSVIKYSEKAVTNGSLVVQSCGFDSIPADLGCQMLADKFAKMGGVMTAADTFLTFDSGNAGFALNYATFEAAVLGFGAVEDLKILRKTSTLKKVNVTRVGPKPSITANAVMDPRVPGKKCLPFPGADASVIRRTQETLSTESSDYMGFHVRCFFTINDSLWSSFKLSVFGGLFQTLAKYEKGRAFLLRYPELCTNWTFKRNGPTAEQIKQSSFKIEIHGSGFKTIEEAKAPGAVPNKFMSLTFGGPDPGYMATSRMLVGAAAEIHRHRKELPTGGVLCPGAVLRKVNLPAILENKGFTFTFKEDSVSVSA